MNYFNVSERNISVFESTWWLIVWRCIEWSFLLDIDPSSPNISGNASGFLRCWLYYWYFKIEIKSCSICRTPISMSITRWRPWRGNRLRLIDRQESWRPSWGKSWENVRHPHSPPQPNSSQTLYLWLMAEHFTNPTPFLFTWVYKLENHAACYSSENKTNDEYIWLFW